jgi:hypothetical protein
MEGNSRRPGSVTAIAVLAIIFTGIGLLFSIPGVILQATGANQQLLTLCKAFQVPETASMYSSMIDALRKYGTLLLISQIILLIIRAGGLTGGILLLSRKPQLRSAGRRALFLYAVFCMIHLAFSTVLEVNYLNEISSSLTLLGTPGIDTGVYSGMVNMMRMSMYLGMAVGVVFSAAWPIIVLIFLNGKRMKEYAA